MEFQNLDQTILEGIVPNFPVLGFADKYGHDAMWKSMYIRTINLTACFLSQHGSRLGPG